jgi:alpha-L-rhamnosidase
MFAFALATLLLLAGLAPSRTSSSGTTTAQAASPSAPVHLRVEGLLEEVAVISEPLPRFSFVHGELATPSFGVTQASYHITVADADATTAGGHADADATAATATAPLWDSGDVTSSNCSQIVYGGKALSPFTRYTWTVAWTSSAGTKSAPATGRFETGPLAVSDWQGAGWLRGCALNPPTHWASCTTGGDTGAKAQFRNEFTVPAGKTVAFARAYVAAAGCAHIEVNGQVPQPDLRGICPWPVTTASVRYVTHDVTGLIVPGKNALGMVAGSVMKAPQAVLLVAIKFQGESSPTFALSSSTAGWMATDSYVTTATAWDR